MNPPRTVTFAFLRRSCAWLIPAAVTWSIVLLATATPASAQRPLTPQHTREVASYLDGIKIAEPVVFDDMAVYPLLVSGPPLLRGRWLTLDAAISSSALVITERRTRTKPVLWAENFSLDEPVFLMKDERIRRGTQTRMVRRDTVLAPGDRIELNVLCA